MSTIDMNSSYIKEAGNDIITLTREINELINDTFSLIENMPLKTGEWQGDAAKSFAAAAKMDKTNYLKLNNNISQYGKYLVEYASNMENVISRVRR